ncbi:MAG: Fructokinase [Candidatus Ordinivivax streblomastigis]|uniref:Fructokinase n=1 Tax=Candidatus Ordinivivax streblomastigis TaxID=2540710 RepID=A0A5M8P207_9BACT|nr:MAG: Fructokinase [Candidatus Ordinivivax streblomastigis]
MRKVIGIGESILDIIFQDNQPQQAVPGGSTFNCMISLGRCGIPAWFVSETGNDPAGQLIRNFMQKNNLSTDYMAVFNDGKSPVSLAFLDEKRNAQYSFYTDYPEKRLNTDFPDIHPDDILIFGSYFAVHPALRTTLRKWLQHAQSQQALLYYDINFRKAHAHERIALLPDFIENFKFADIIRCSDEDLEILFPNETIESIYKRYFQPHHQSLIVTQGEKNIIVQTPSFQKEYWVAAITPVSTIGAGDNFNAGLVYGLLKSGIYNRQISDLQENEWDKLIALAKAFAANVCASLENYISFDFANYLTKKE